MSDVRITHIGGPTALIEVDGWRLLTDPTFDAPGRRYSFGWGTSSRKLAGPAIAAADLPPIDAVLLTHDHHGDNLDPSGRALLPSAGVVVTTVSGAKRLGGTARGHDHPGPGDQPSPLLRRERHLRDVPARLGGSALSMYGSWGFYDNLVHFITPLLTTAMFYLLLVRLGVLADFHDLKHLHHRIGFFMSAAATVRS